MNYVKQIRQVEQLQFVGFKLVYLLKSNSEVGNQAVESKNFT